ncbi:hypothetical protein [Haliangium ochraceum]|nr:hypothetical protein [Haliangium ochraceum]
MNSRKRSPKKAADAPLDAAADARGCGHCSADGDSEPGVLRCECGSLLARYVPGGVELKCRRCKRLIIIPVTGAHEAAMR